MSQSTVASSRRSLRVVPPPAPRAVPRTFPVRFNATPGLASRLRPAQNSSRWVGAGTVVLDAHGIQITARRLTLLGPRRTGHFIHSSEIREVYREGDAIRIDLNGAARRTFVRLWAQDAALAAEIVRLLPTSRTIEIEGAAAERAGPSVFRARDNDTHGSLLWFVPLVILAGVLGWLVLVPGSQVPTSRPQKPVGVQAPAVIHPARIPYALSLEARSDLQKFIPRTQALAVQFSMSLDAVQRGNISREDFQASLERWLLPQWELLTFELSSVPATNSVRTDADAQINAVVGSWRLVLATYAQGLRDNNPHEVLKAFDYLRDAEAHEHEAVALLDRLEAAQ